MTNPFQKRRKFQPKKHSRVRGREILYGEAKTARRRELFERSGGKCEADSETLGFTDYWKGAATSTVARCNAPITWETMEWSHNRHGSNKDDSLANGIASCRDCHRAKHASQGIPRRPGKIMNLKKAKEYWEGKICFCDGPKKSQETFCPECSAKVSKQTLYTLQNADDPEIYRQTLAEAENEILLYV